MNALAIALALALSAVHYLSELYAEHTRRHHSRIISFSAGAFLTLLFLEVLPLAHAFPHGPAAMLLGFIAFHSLERYVYHHYPKSSARKGVGELDAVGFFLNNFMNGFILVLAFSSSDSMGYAIFLALLLHTVSSSLMLAHILEKISGLHAHRLALSLSTFAGGLVAGQLGAASLAAGAAFAFITGALFYVVVRDMLPKDSLSRLPYFLAGVMGMYFTLLLVGAA